MYNASMFTTFMAERPSPAELGMFRHSLAPRVMLLWDQADDDTIIKLCDIPRYRSGNGHFADYTHLVLRMGPDVLMRTDEVIQAQWAQKQRSAGNLLDAIVVDNEWDEGICWRWHDTKGKACDWQNTPPGIGQMSLIERKAHMIGATAALLKRTLVSKHIPTFVSAAYSMRGYTEDDAPDPGLFTARELTGPDYYGYKSAISGNAVHYYDGGWYVPDPPYQPVDGWRAYMERVVGARLATQTNVHRFKQAVRFWSGYHHYPTWWEEVNTMNSGMSEVEHMQACVGKSKLLIHSVNAEGYYLGERVACLAPFTTTGLGNAYPRQYVMSSADSYEVVRQHMMEEGYTDA